MTEYQAYHHEAILGSSSPAAKAGSIAISESITLGQTVLNISSGTTLPVIFNFVGQTPLNGTIFQAKQTGLHAVNIMIPIASNGVGGAVVNQWNTNIELRAEVWNADATSLSGLVQNNPKMLVRGHTFTPLGGSETPRIFAQAFLIYMHESERLKIVAQDVAFSAHPGYMAQIDVERKIQIMELTIVGTGRKATPKMIFQSPPGVNDMPGPYTTQWSHTATLGGWVPITTPLKPNIQGALDIEASGRTGMAQTGSDVISTDGTSKYILPFGSNGSYTAETIPIVNITPFNFGFRWLSTTRGLYLVQAKIRISNTGATNTSLRFGWRKVIGAIDVWTWNMGNFGTPGTQINPTCVTTSFFIINNNINEQYEIWWGANNGSNVRAESGSYARTSLVLPF